MAASRKDTSSPVSVSSDSTLNYQMYDLICVGFGPASLAIAVALLESNIQPAPRVLFLEKQARFAWHSGMLLPGARMQISFIKDMASLRNPRSYFTFLNYLHQNDRLVDFTNLDTFLPRREEYNDYLTWCASHFDDDVRYGEEVTSVEPMGEKTVEGFRISSRTSSGESEVRQAKHVIVAVGGRANIPSVFPKDCKRVVHSSQYSNIVDGLLSDKNANYKLAVLGAGQSAAEIFADLGDRFPNAKTNLIFKSDSLKPSDDSPFVNEIFNPSKVDELFAMDPSVRTAVLTRNKATNYGVVRLGLLERLFDDQYMQKLRNPDQSTWAHRIHPYTVIESAKNVHGGDRILLRTKNVLTGVEEESEYDAIIVATGYVRSIHKEILKDCEEVLAKTESGETDWSTDRSYRCKFRDGKVPKDAGIWLQGCNESTHGLSDTLLSILSVRAGEVVDAMFGKAEPAKAAFEEIPVPKIQSARAAKGKARRLSQAVNVEAATKKEKEGCNIF